MPGRRAESGAERGRATGIPKGTKIIKIGAGGIREDAKIISRTVKTTPKTARVEGWRPNHRAGPTPGRVFDPLEAAWVDFDAILDPLDPGRTPESAFF